MSGIFKSIGKVFKSVIKVVKKVVKGAFKLVKKIAPVALAAAAIYFGGTALAGGFTSGAGGLAASSGAVTGSGLAGTAAAINTTAGAAGALASSGSIFSSSLLSNPVFSSISGLGKGISAVGGFLKDNSALVKIGAGALQGVQDQKQFNKSFDLNKSQFDQNLAQRKEENNFQGSVYGVDRNGNATQSNQDNAYTAQQPISNPDSQNARLDQSFENAQANSGLLDLYNQAYYKKV